MTDNERIKVVRATYEIKQKAGSGGFDAKAVQYAEGRLKNAAEIFPSAAKHDLDKLDMILKELLGGNLSEELIAKTKASAHEINVNAQMFSYPLVSAVAESLVSFCTAVKKISPLSVEVVALHLQTLRIALGKGPRAITGQDKAELLDGLERAGAKALGA
jgi:hypothetical protein